MALKIKLPRLSPRLVAGALLILLPGAMTLLAEDKPAAPKVSVSPPAARAVATSTAPSTAAAIQKHKEEEIARVMEFFKATQPDVYAQAQTLRDTDPTRFEKLVRPVFSTVNRLEDLKKKNPKLFDLTMQDLQHNYQSLRMSRELKKTDLSPADRDKLLSDLNLVVAEQFDIRLQIRQQEIDDLTKQLNDLSAKLQANQKDRDAKIAKRVNDLVEKTPRLDW